MNLGEFLHMGGYGFYVWSSYIVTALVIVCELVSLRARVQRARGRTSASTTKKGQAR
jgi:heme exporter protein CcmD